MAKSIYRLIDESGRVLIPQEFRKQADMGNGDIVKLTIDGSKLILTKVDIVEVGNQDPAMVEAFVNAVIKSMSKEKQVALASQLLQMAERNGEK